MILNLLAYGGMLDDAFMTGLITENEYKLLTNIVVNYGIYEKDVSRAMEDGFIDEDESKHLRSLRKAIYQNALRTSLKKKVITGEEKEILDILKDSVGLDDETLKKIEDCVKKELRVQG
ncbi:hypothetical protein BMS3Abin16_01403 [archaeon BMS3Abin16]|nr:hypothetical protein BMS3Abin16_01403 [archaeon BMS3Abin16]